MNEINWDWFAGFYQAEGSVTGDRVNSNPQMALCTKDTSVIDFIEKFLHCENVQLRSYRYNYTHHTTFNTVDMEHFSIYARKHLQPIINELYPRIYHNVKQKVYEWANSFGIELSNTQLPLTWDFVAGFWEGDGYMSRAPSPGSVYFGFTQKEPEILYGILKFVGKGNIRKFKPDNGDYAHDLRIFDGKSGGNRISQIMLQHVRSLICHNKVTEALQFSKQDVEKQQKKYREHNKQDWKEHLNVSKYLKEHPEVAAKYRSILAKETQI